jgi:16S rRNA (guanine966-N2)-methyltransferase
VIGGQYRSRPLRSIPGLDIRPTADRLRETLFNVLTAGNPDALQASVWADLYAGTGAVGIEAISRGAGQVFFVESSQAAARVLERNLASLGVRSGFVLVRGEALKALRRWETEKIVLDYVFLDPPYRLEKEYQSALELLGKSSLLKESSLVIAEHAKRFVLGDEVGGLSKARTLTQGDASLSFYRHP